MERWVGLAPKLQAGAEPRMLPERDHRGERAEQRADGPVLKLLAKCADSNSMVSVLTAEGPTFELTGPQRQDAAGPE